MKYFLDTEFHEYKKKFWFRKPIDTIELISIGIATDDFRKYYAICNEFDIKAAWKNEWLRENVLRPIYDEHIEGLMKKLTKFQSILHDLIMFRSLKKFNLRTMKLIFEEYGKSKAQIAKEIVEFTGGTYNEVQGEIGHYSCDTNPEFYAYYADYDWVVFCWLFGRMIDLPRGFPMYCRDLKQMVDDNYYKFEKKEVQPIDFISWLDGIKMRPDYPKQENEHNALDDAIWNRKLFKFLLKL